MTDRTKNTISNQKRERRRENDKVKWDEISLIKNSFSHYVGVASAVSQTLRAFPHKKKRKRKRKWRQKAFLPKKKHSQGLVGGAERDTF